jgi:predicted outer membrane repeat protein
MHRQNLFISVIMTIFIVLATITPTHAQNVVVADCDFASLQSAVATVNDGGGIITFDCVGTIVFTEELFITDEVSIVGDGNIIFDGGGATRLFNVSEDFTLDGLTLQNGSSDFGSAIYHAGHNLTIHNSTFSGHSGVAGTIYNGGTVTITDSTFTNNHDGVIVNYILWSTIIISNSTFTNNSSRDGGVIRGIRLTITNSVFTDNSATLSGGAIFTGGWATITDSTFTNNSASYGGAISYNHGFHRDGSLTITNTVFTDNSATQSGGAIYHNDNTLTIKDSTFSDNFAPNGPSGIFSNGLIIIQDTHYENNTCGGAGIFTNSGGNTADNADGCLSDVVPATATVTDCDNFTGDGTISQAVAIANLTNEPIRFDCTGTIIFTDELTITGTVKIIDRGNIIFDSAGKTQFFVVKGSGSLAVYGFTFQNGSGATGSSIDNSGRLSINNSTFLNSVNTDFSFGGGGINNTGILLVNNSTFSGHSGPGGMIFNYRGIITVMNSTFINNHSGAITSQDKAIIMNSTFINNHNSRGNGGAVNGVNDGLDTNNGTNTDNNLIIRNSVFIDNSSVHNLIIIDDSSIRNSSVGNGGAVSHYGGKLTVTGSTFINNFAPQRGGAIYHARNKAVITGNIFLDNSAFEGGGIFSNDTLMSQNSYYENNTCEGHGVFTDEGGNTAENAIGCPPDIVITSTVVSDCDHFTGDGTLSQAVTNANLTGEPITFACSGTIMFTNPLTITGDVTIMGGGDITFDGGGATSFFLVEGSPTADEVIKPSSLMIDGLTLQNGSARMITNTLSGTLIISNSTLEDNRGVIYNRGALTIINSTISENSNLSGGNGLIEGGGTLIIAHSTFTGNLTRRGIIINSNTSIITDSTFTDNVATSCGVILNGGMLTINNSTFTNNSATENGGAICNANRIAITNSTFTGNSAIYNGGAISNGTPYSMDNIGTLTITDSTLSDNVATEGDAIFNASNSTLLSQDTHYENNDCGGSSIFTDNGGNRADNADGCPNGS